MSNKIRKNKRIKRLLSNANIFSRYSDQAKWQPLEDVTDSQSGEILSALATSMSSEISNIRVFLNNQYQVVRCDLGFSETAGRFFWLSIKLRSKEPVRDWRHLQQIKNECCGVEFGGCEIFPPESNLVDSANQYHLWCFEKSQTVFPFAFQERVISNEPLLNAAQRPFQTGLERKTTDNVAHAISSSGE